MAYYRRRLPHWTPDHAILFITWRLAGSAPRRVDLPPAPCAGLGSFVHQDGRLARATSGPVWLRDPRIASMLEQVLRYGERVRKLYALHAWVIMPNHVHVILEPRQALAPMMRWLKGRTSRKANQIPGRTGLPFWQDESFDHWVRTAEELNQLISYVERNPVQAGLAEREDAWPWSSARSEADDGSRSSAPQSSIAATKCRWRAQCCAPAAEHGSAPLSPANRRRTARFLGAVVPSSRAATRLRAAVVPELLQM
jgi:REP element-mobilizing transposase RayT